VFFFFFFFFEKVSRKFSFHLNLTIEGTLHEYHYIFLIMPCSVLRRMRNVSVKSCTETENTHLKFNNLFSKIVPFVR